MIVLGGRNLLNHVKLGQLSGKLLELGTLNISHAQKLEDSFKFTGLTAVVGSGNSVSRLVFLILLSPFNSSFLFPVVLLSLSNVPSGLCLWVNPPFGPAIATTTIALIAIMGVVIAPLRIVDTAPRHICFVFGTLSLLSKISDHFTVMSGVR